MARPYWSGRIQISLVSFGVQLFVATEAKSQINFHQISRSTGERVRHQKVLQSAVDEPNEAPSAAISTTDIVKGYEYEKGQYVLIEPSELAELRVPSKHTIEVTQFIDLTDLQPEYVEKPYFVIPEKDGDAEAFAVVRRALQKTGKVAVGKIAFSGREHVLAIRSAGNDDRGGMIAYTLRYRSEIRNESDYLRDIKPQVIDKESLELAEALIAKRSSPLDLGKFQDGYEIALKELVDAKLNHLPAPKDSIESSGKRKVASLMDALKKSLGGTDPKPAPQNPEKKPVASVKAQPKKGIGLVNPTTKAAIRRKTA